MSKRYQRVKSAPINLLKRIAASHIIDTVCKEYAVEPKEALSKTMKPVMLEAKQSAIYILRELGLNVREIACFTGVPFTSISRHIKKVNDIISVDSSYREKIKMLHFSILQKHVDSSTLYGKDETTEPKTEDFR